MNENTQIVESVEIAQATTTEVQSTEMTWKDALTISAFGMGIVFVGLVLTFCYISSLPLIAGDKSKKKKSAKGAEVKTEESRSSASDDGSLEPELQAAIAYVIAAEQEYERMTDYTKITIRRDENQRAWGVAGKMRTLATRKISKK